MGFAERGDGALEVVGGDLAAHGEGGEDQGCSGDGSKSECQAELDAGGVVV